MIEFMMINIFILIKSKTMNLNSQVDRLLLDCYMVNSHH